MEAPFSVEEAMWRKFIVGAAVQAPGNIRAVQSGAERRLVGVADGSLVARFHFEVSGSGVYVGLRGNPWDGPAKAFFASAIRDVLASVATREVVFYRGDTHMTRSRDTLEVQTQAIRIEWSSLKFVKGKELHLRPASSYTAMKQEEVDEEEDEILDVQDQDSDDAMFGSRAQQLSELMFGDDPASRCSFVFWFGTAAGIDRVREHILTNVGPTPSFLYNEYGSVSQSQCIGDATGMSAQPPYAFLIGEAFRGTCYYKGFCVAKDDFPHGGFAFREPTPRPSPSSEGFCVLDGKGMDDAWIAALDDVPVLQELFHRLSIEYHRSGAANRRLMAADFGDSASTAGQFGRSLSRFSVRTKLLASSKKIFEGPKSNTIPLRNDLESTMWALSPAPRPRAWFVSPFVHVLAAYHGKSLFSYLCKQLESSPAVEPTAVLPEETFEKLQTSMELLGIKLSGESIKFHESVGGPLLYAKVGRLHHIVKRFSGRELLVQMLVATAEERQFALLYDLQEVQMQPPRTVMNDQCWNIVDAVLFFLNLREAERKRAAPEECAPRGSKRTQR